jgi:Bacterial SH3 domain
MKFFVTLSAVLFSVALQAQITTFYTAAEAGLSMRETPDKNGKTIEKIAYGEKVTADFKYIPADSVVQRISTEGYDGIWQRIIYKGKTGYVVNSYLWEMPPPRKGTKTLQEYVKQLSTPAGAPVVIKKNYGEFIETTKKQLYKNGIQINIAEGYESHSETWIIPGLTIENGFMLIKLLKQFPEMIDSKSFFPAADQKIKKGDIEVSVKVMKECSGDGTEKYCTLYKVMFSYEQGGYYDLELMQLDGELVISFGGGV